MMNPWELSEHLANMSKQNIIFRKKGYNPLNYGDEYFNNMLQFRSGFSNYFRINSSIRRSVLRFGILDSIVDFDPNYFNRGSMRKLSEQSRYEVTSRILEEIK